MSDKTIADVGRRLAEALMSFARERHDDDRKRIAALQTELCATLRAEAAEEATSREDLSPQSQ